MSKFAKKYLFMFTSHYRSLNIEYQSLRCNKIIKINNLNLHPQK